MARSGIVMLLVAALGAVCIVLVPFALLSDGRASAQARIDAANAAYHDVNATLEFALPDIAIDDVGEVASKCRKPFARMRQSFLSVNRFAGRRLTPELTALRIFQSYLDQWCDRPNTTSVAFIDVGANDGEDVRGWQAGFGRSSASPCRNKTIFYLVEPQARYREALARVTRESGNAAVRVVIAAIGRDEQHGRKVQLTGSGQQALAAFSAPNGSDAKALTTSAVTTVVSLRRVLIEDGFPAGAPVLVLKVDCEGADATIVTDNRPLFEAQRVGLLVMELNRQQWQFPASHAHAVVMLRQCGYVTFMLGVDPTTDESVLVRMSAAQLVAWKPRLETLVAVHRTIAAEFVAAHRRRLNRRINPVCAVGEYRFKANEL